MQSGRPAETHSRWANVLRVLSLVAMVDATSALSLAAPEEPTVTTVACGVVALLPMCVSCVLGYCMAQCQLSA